MKEFKEFEKVIVLYKGVLIPGTYQCYNKSTNKHIVGFMEFEDADIFDYENCKSMIGNGNNIGTDNSDETKSTERPFFMPKNGQSFFRISSDGEVVKDIYDANSYVYKKYASIGNCFEKHEDAVKYSYEFKKLLERVL